MTDLNSFKQHKKLVGHFELLLLSTPMFVHGGHISQTKMEDNGVVDVSENAQPNEKIA